MGWGAGRRRPSHRPARQQPPVWSLPLPLCPMLRNVIRHRGVGRPRRWHTDCESRQGRVYWRRGLPTRTVQPAPCALGVSVACVRGWLCAWVCVGVCCPLPDRLTRDSLSLGARGGRAETAVVRGASSHDGRRGEHGWQCARAAGGLADLVGRAAPIASGTRCLPRFCTACGSARSSVVSYALRTPVSGRCVARPDRRQGTWNDTGGSTTFDERALSTEVRTTSE